MLTRHKLRIRVLQILYALEASGQEKTDLFSRQLQQSLERLYDLYLLLLALLADIHHEAVLEREKVREKFFPDPLDLLPETAFTRNLVLNKISSSETLQKQLQKRGLGWGQHPELALRLFRAIRENPFYLEYIKANKNSGKLDKAFLLKILDDPILKDCNLISVVEEDYLFGLENFDVVLGMTARTVSNIKVKEPLELLPEITSDHEDYQFALTLGITAIEKKEIFNQYILRSLKNWEPDRVAPLDMLLLRLGAAELHAFSEIPVKVTLNEFIDISKEYSTPKSAQFLNGVLDTMLRLMQKEGMVVKAGRGLVTESPKASRKLADM
jgi:N utilization substance protein B